METIHGGKSAHALDMRDQIGIHQCIDPEGALFGFTGLYYNLYLPLFRVEVAEILGRLLLRKLSGLLIAGNTPMDYGRALQQLAQSEFGNLLLLLALLALIRKDS